MKQQLTKKEIDNLTMVKTLLEKRGSTEPDDIIFAPIGETELVSKLLMYSIKDLIVTIRPNAIQFSTSSINFFSHTNYISMNVDRKNRWLVVTAHVRDAIDSHRWCSIKDGKRESKKLTGKDFPNRIYPLMNWNKAFYYKALGYLASAPDEDYEPFLAYKLEDFRGIALSTTAREAAGVNDSDVGEEMLSKLREFERKQEKERKAAEARGSKFVPGRFEIIGGIPEGSFGLQRKIRKEISRVPEDVMEFIKREKQ